MSVSPNVLRHFAVLTLIITGGIAMFANGENQNALAEQIRQRQMETTALRAERERATKHTVVVDGLRIAPGTRLGNADTGDDAVMTTNTVPAGPLQLADFPQASTDGPSGPPGIGPGNGKANGVTVPPPPMNMRMRGKPGQPQSPVRRTATPPSEQEVNALIQASARRAGPATIE